MSLAIAAVIRRLNEAHSGSFWQEASVPRVEGIFIEVLAPDMVPGIPQSR